MSLNSDNIANLENRFRVMVFNVSEIELRIFSRDEHASDAS